MINIFRSKESYRGKIFTKIASQLIYWFGIDILGQIYFVSVFSQTIEVNAAALRNLINYNVFLVIGFHKYNFIVYVDELYHNFFDPTTQHISLFFRDIE